MLHQLGVIEQAIQSLHDYIARKTNEISEASNSVFVDHTGKH